MLKVGFSRLDVTPPLGADLSGYFFRRAAKGVRDPLYLNALAITNEKDTIILMAIDYIGIELSHNIKIRKLISERTGVLEDHIMIAALHQHTSPCLADPEKKPTSLRDEKYIDVLYRKFADAAVMAIDDMQEATMRSAALGVSEPIGFVRRYFTADGSVQTNPSAKYTLTGRCAEADNNVRLVRFCRENANDIALINFSTHPDVIGGDRISADWPGFTRKYVEEDIEGVSAIFFTGCQGDSNHIDYFKPKEERIKNNNGYDHSKYMGRTVAEAVKKAWDNTKEETCDGEIFSENVLIYNKTNLEGVDEYERYKAWYDDYEAGKLSYSPHITELAYAARIVRLRTAPVFHPVPLTVMGVGSVAFVGFGGEAFTAYGAAMRALAPEKFVVCAVCANGYQGYFPTEEAFSQGGYEAKSSLFTPTLESEIVSAAKDIFQKHNN